MKKTDKKNKLPYRFTCPIPGRAVGHVEFTEEEKKKNREVTLSIIRYYGLEKEFGLDKEPKNTNDYNK